MSLTPPSLPPPPPPIYPQYPQPDFRPYKSGTNGFALASLIFGIIGGLLFSIVFGIVGLVQTKNSGQKGRGFAIAGLVLSAVWIAIIAVVVAVALGSKAQRDSTGTITSGGSIGVRSLRLGDCVADDVTSGTEIRELQAVPCSAPHRLEVFASLRYDESSFPGGDALVTEAQTRCSQALFDKPAPVSRIQGMHIFFLHPTQLAWDQGDRHLTCAVRSDDARTGSIYGGGTVIPRALTEGRCITELTTGRSITEVPVTPCSSPHRGEVYASLRFTNANYPGDKAINTAARKRCSAALDQLALPGSSLRGTYDLWFVPTAGAWSLGDRHLTCVLVSNTKRTGAVTTTAS